MPDSTFSVQGPARILELKHSAEGIGHFAAELHNFCRDRRCYVVLTKERPVEHRVPCEGAYAGYNPHGLTHLAKREQG